MQNNYTKLPRPIIRFLSSNSFLILLSILLLSAAIIFWQVQETSNLTAITEETAALVRSYARETETRFEYIHEALILLADQYDTLDSNRIERWKEDANFYTEAFIGLDAIALVDQTYRIQEIVPESQESGLLGQSATNLASESELLYIWVPIYEDTSFHGFILAVMDLGNFLSPVVAETKGAYDLQLSEESTVVFETISPFEPDQRFSATEPMTFENETILQLTFSPTPAAIRSALFAARNSFIFSLLGAAFTVTTVFVAQNFNKLAASSQEHYRSLFNASRDAIFVINPDGEYLDASPSALHLSGYTLEELQALTVDALVHEQSSPPSYDRAVLWEQGGQIEFSLGHKDGYPIPVEMAVSPVHLEGKVQFIFGIARDITDRKELEDFRQHQQEQLETLVEERTAELNLRVEEVEHLNTTMNQMVVDLQTANRNLELTQRRLQNSNEELEAFSYSVSHDLRSPLRHIDGFLNLLLQREKGNLDDISLHYIENVMNSTRHMSDLINNLLQLSRTSRAELHMQTVNTQELVASVIEELRHSFDHRSVVFKVGDLPVVTGDRTLLRVVWTNLLNNAVKFTQKVDRAKIRIDAQSASEESTVTFSVKDNGAGFNQEYANKLFMAFQRLHTETEYQGSGIGLATVKRIIHRHGGEVWAQGEEGTGATFYFKLTAMQPEGE